MRVSKMQPSSGSGTRGQGLSALDGRSRDKSAIIAQAADVLVFDCHNGRLSYDSETHVRTGAPNNSPTPIWLRYPRAWNPVGQPVTNCNRLKYNPVQNHPAVMNHEKRPRCF
jgi:hypothetical protein